VDAFTDTSDEPFIKAFFGELRRLGYFEGENLLIERYSGEGRATHHPDLARDVVRRDPDLIVAVNTPLVLDLKAATTTIPIVGVFAHPVEVGIVPSIARSGGNITGVSVDIGNEQWGKRLQLLRQVVPHLTTLAFLSTPAVREQVLQLPELGRRLGVTSVNPLLKHPVTEAEYRRVFASLAQSGIDGIAVDDEPEHLVNLKVIIELDEKNRLPVIYPFKLLVEARGLMSYGVDEAGLGQHAAAMAGQILKGAYAVSAAGECAIWACRFAGRPVGVDWMIFWRSGRDAAGASSTVWVGLDSSVSPHSWLAECVGCADVLCALEEHVPIPCLRPRLEVVEGDVGELTAERCAIDRVADTVEPLVHLGAVLTHALADDVQRDLEIGERATGDTREDGEDVVARELVAPEVEALACEAAWILEEANGDGPDVRDGDLRELSRRRERRGVDALRELLFAEIEVLHEIDGRQDRGAYADLGDVLFDLVLAVEVRDARLSIGGAGRGEDEMYACGLGRVRGGDALSRLGLGASFEWRRHREEGGRSFERLRERGRVFE
jgi:putative ABC transport system substrate-binding protein